VNIKDLKGLYQNYRQLNKYRRRFIKDDFSFICDIFLKDIYKFNSMVPLDSSKSEGFLIKFNLNNKVIQRIKETPEFITFNFLIVILHLIDSKYLTEAYDSLQFLLDYLKVNDIHTLSYLRSKTYYYLCLVAEKLNKYNLILEYILYII